MNQKKVILIILDGFGANPMTDGNAVYNAKTPFLDACWGNFPKTLLQASGQEVGLPFGEMGNSEVGHINIGTGRIPLQDLARINKTIEDGNFYKTQYLLEACAWAKKNNSTLQLIGLISNGGIHADLKHLLALIELAKKEEVQKVAIHLFTDGRDMPAKSAEMIISKLQAKIDETGVGKIATMIGRFYAMDRDNNWDRIQKAYDLMVLGKGKEYTDFKSALQAQYAQGEDDEKLSPVVLDKSGLINDNDAVIFFNFRADRSRQITEPLISLDFNKFKREKFPNNLRVITFVSYGNEQTPLVNVAYMEDLIHKQLAEIISLSGMSQLHIAETEKYAHVTYFFNGGQEKEFANEERIIIPSLKVKSYDQIPEMSASALTSKFIQYFHDKSPHFSVLNYANPDMVGHTGNYEATLRAIQVVDACIKKLVLDTFDENTSIIITSDHGNADQMIDPQTQEPDKQHTTNAVPFVVIEAGSNLKNALENPISIEEKLVFFSQQPSGVLADISPTVLNFLELKKSDEMTGNSLKDII